MIIYNDFLRHDYREETAAMQYILYRVCKKKNNKYIPIEFSELKWIIDRANFYHACNHNLVIISYDFFNWYNEVDFIPDTFAVDYTAEFSYVDFKFINSGKNPNYTYLSFLSGAEKYSLNKAIRQYKVYGKYLLHFSNRIYLLKSNIKKRLKWKIK